MIPKNREFDDQDEYCPNCDNHFVIEAKEGTPKLVIDKVEMMDSRMKQRLEEDLDWS